MTISTFTGISFAPGTVRTATIGNLPSGGAITSSSILDGADVFILSQTTATVLLSNPAPSDTSKVRVVRWYNGGTVPVWNAYGQYLAVGGFADQTYIPGTGWKGVGTNSPQEIALSTTDANYPLDTNANNMTLVTVPGGFAAVGSSFDITFVIDNTSGTSNKTVVGKFGTFNFYNIGSLLASATGFLTLDRRVYVSGAAAQKSGPNILSNAANGINGTSQAGTQNTAVDFAIQATVTKGTGADVTTLKMYRILYTHGA